MDKHEFMRKWEAHSNLRLIGDERDRFLEECALILYLDDDVLEMALKVASRKRVYDLQYIEMVGLHLRQYLHRVKYETIHGEGKSACSQTRDKDHLTLITGGKSY